MNDFFIGTGGDLTNRIIEKMFGLAEDFFATHNDPSQIPVTTEALARLNALHPATVLFRLEEGELVSWIVSLPTQRALMEQFLHGEITERQLLEKTVPQETYEALYMCSAFTVEVHRRKGYALSLFAEALRRLPLEPSAPLFAWPVSYEGKMTAEKLHRLLPRPFFIKE